MATAAPVTTPIMARATILAANTIAGASLLALGIFLYRGPTQVFELNVTDAGALVIDAALSAAFFLQHSGMIRTSFRNRLTRYLPRHYNGAFYAIASGVTLMTLLVLWQPTDLIVMSVGRPYRWLFRMVFVAATIGFVWGIRSLGSFDGFGIRPIRAHLRGEPVRKLPLTVRGPYTWVRHPLYTMVLLMIWSCPDLTGDRLLFNLTWTGWMIVGTILEERDLVAEFGEDYRRYQRDVPMLLPLRRSRSRGAGPSSGRSPKDGAG